VEEGREELMETKIKEGRKEEGEGMKAEKKVWREVEKRKGDERVKRSRI
jgi:hypothetical protein